MTEDYTRFRRWLIDKLKQSRWARMKGESIEHLGVRLGVQPDVLIVAQRELHRERRAAGLRPISLGEHQRPHQVTSKKLLLLFPKAVYADWKQLCDLRGIKAATMLRSLIHTLLSGPRNPTWTGRWWIYHGRRYPLDKHSHHKRTSKKWPYVTHTTVTHGAAAALTMRADGAGTTVTALMRGQVIDLLEGRLERLNIINAPGAMFDDEKRYWTGTELGE